MRLHEWPSSKLARDGYSPPVWRNRPTERSQVQVWLSDARRASDKSRYWPLEWAGQLIWRLCLWNVWNWARPLSLRTPTRTKLNTGRIERSYGSTFIVHIIPRNEAGPNPKPLSVRRPCKLVLRPDGAHICDAHMVGLVESTLQGEQNEPGLGHLKAWACPVSGKQFLEADGM